MNTRYERNPLRHALTTAHACFLTLCLIIAATNPSIAQWTKTDGPYGGDVSCFAVMGTNIFAGTFGGGVFRSTDNGTSWTAANTGLTGTRIRAYAVTGTSVFAAAFPGGVFHSANNGASWTAVNTDLTNTYVWSLAVSGTHLFAGPGTGVWKRPLSEMITSVERLSSEIPADFSLTASYPNPFHSATTISFALRSQSYTSLKVFDATGREVATLVSEWLPVGTYSRTWNALHVPDGVYYYRLQAGSFSETKNIVLQR